MLSKSRHQNVKYIEKVRLSGEGKRKGYKEKNIEKKTSSSRSLIIQEHVNLFTFPLPMTQRLFGN